MRFRILLSLVVLTALSACSSVPTKDHLRICPDSDAKIGWINTISIIADACLLRDVLGNDDYYSISESKFVQSHMLEAARAYVTFKGYTISSVQVPFVCSFNFMDRDAGKQKPLKFAEEKGGKIKEKIPPLAEADDLAGTPEYRQALLNVIFGVMTSSDPSKNYPEICCSSGEMKESAQIIGSHTGSNTTLFIVGQGVVVSAGKQLTQGLTTGLLTAAITLETVSFAAMDMSRLAYMRNTCG